jgi:hypothetical protein
LTEDGLERRTLTNDVAKGERLPNLLPEMIPLEFDLLAKPGHFLEGSRIGEGDGCVVGKCSKPLELALPDMTATEDG